MPEPLAYHITWTAYGSWLHGDARGWVMSGIACIQPASQEILSRAEQTLKQQSITFNPLQRELITKTIQDHCVYRGWLLHALNARSNHVHLVVSADRTPEEVMSQLKAWCSRRLTEQAKANQPLDEDNPKPLKWFTEHGSTKWINDEAYLEAAIAYVIEQ